MSTLLDNCPFLLHIRRAHDFGSGVLDGPVPHIDTFAYGGLRAFTGIDRTASC